MRMWTSRAPASRIICTSLTEVVPRTIESSTRTMLLPSTSAELALCLSLTPRLRTSWLGWMKVRPREIDMLEDAWARSDFLERTEGTDPAVIDQHQLARIDVAHEARANHIER